MNRLFLLTTAMLLVIKVTAQVGINGDGALPDPSAGLEVKFTDKGLLPPRMTTLQRNGIPSPARGLVIFNTDCNDLQVFNGTGWIPVGNTGHLDTPGPITGSSVPCAGSLGIVYSVEPVAGADGYSWNLPAGAAVVAGQGTHSITANIGLAGGLVCVTAYQGCVKSPMQCMQANTGMIAPVSVSVAPSFNPCCAGTLVTFTAVPVNGGNSPLFQWHVNGTMAAGATNSTYGYVPSDGDTITCNVTSSQLCATNNPATSNPVVMEVIPVSTPGVSITVPANPFCAGTAATFTATQVNGGTSPAFQWLLNGMMIPGATNSTFDYFPASGDIVTCRMTSSLPCLSANPVMSNTIVMSETVTPAAPVSAGNTSTQTQVVWKWHPVAGATGYKWSTVNSYATAVSLGTDTAKTETGLACGTAYTRYVWAWNSCFSSAVTTLSQSTSACTYPCAASVTVNHVAGVVAPVNKTVVYGGVTGVTGAPAKCWITGNLGADHTAISVTDASEASAGWYWQFNRKQGYKHDGSAPNPGWTITGINENSDWISANDPCTLEMGAIWRIPTYTEWFNVDNLGGWTNYNSAWNSPLKLHASGCLGWAAGDLYSRGSSGYFWSSTRESNSNGHGMTIYSGGSYLNPYNKAYGFPLRCLHD